MATPAPRKSSREGAGKRQLEAGMIGGDPNAIHKKLVYLCAYTVVVEVHPTIAQAIEKESHGRLIRRQHEGSVRYQVNLLKPAILIAAGHFRLLNY
jgi:hypothetical protein